MLLSALMSDHCLLTFLHSHSSRHGIGSPFQFIVFELSSSYCRLWLPVESSLLGRHVLSLPQGRNLQRKGSKCCSVLPTEMQHVPHSDHLQSTLSDVPADCLHTHHDAAFGVFLVISLFTYVNFTHVMCGSLCIEFSKFQMSFSLQTGMDYRVDVLQPGYTVDPSQSLAKFLGRPPNQDAFLVSLGLQPSGK